MPLTEAQIEYYEHQVLLAAVCNVAWLSYDTLIHLDVEIQYIWLRRQSWVQYMYFFIRYVPIFHLGAVMTLARPYRWTVTACKVWIYEELIFAELLMFAVELVLMMRLYVLYSRNKIILAVMFAALIAEVTVMATTLGIVLPKLTYRSGCLISSSPGLFMAFWLSTLVFETFLFLLTLFKFRQSVIRNLGKHSVLYIFIRDGTWAFSLIFVALLLNMLMYKLNHTPLVGMGYGWALSAASFSGSHILLNLRSIGMRDRDPSELSTLPTFGPSSSTSGHPSRAHWQTNFTTVNDVNDSILEEPEDVELGTIEPSGSPKPEDGTLSIPTQSYLRTP